MTIIISSLFNKQVTANKTTNNNDSKTYRAWQSQILFATTGVRINNARTGMSDANARIFAIFRQNISLSFQSVESFWHPVVFEAPISMKIQNVILVLFLVFQSLFYLV